MTTLRPTNFRLEEELLDALQVIKERDGVPLSEQVRRALFAWIESRGIRAKATRKPAALRRRASPLKGGARP